MKKRKPRDLILGGRWFASVDEGNREIVLNGGQVEPKHRQKFAKWVCLATKYLDHNGGHGVPGKD